jgi:hypothetical protein
MSSDLVSEIGLGSECKFDGKTWVVSPISNDIRGQFQRWLVRQAFEFVDSLPFNRIRREGMQNQIVRDGAAHQYDWDSEACNDVLLTTAGIKAIFLIRLQVRHPHADEKLVDKMFEEMGWEKALLLMKLADGEGKKKEAPPTPASPETPSASENSAEKSSKNSPT